jgi:CheY-like chemotaxis protein
MPPALLVLCGPPLPGRWTLARRIQRQLGAVRFSLHGLPRFADIELALADGRCVLVDGDLPTALERRVLFDLAPDHERVLVDWRCSRAEAEREIFHRYASRPLRLAERELARFEADCVLRHLADGELDGVSVVIVGAGMPLGDQVVRVSNALLPRPPADPPASVRGVLIVEDDDDERAILADVLRELGYLVEVAPDAGVALALVEDGAEIDLVLSDHHMPGMTGAELVHTLAGRYPQIRAVLLTGRPENPVIDEAERGAAVAVLQKPVHVIDLQRAIDEAISLS